MIRLTTAHTVVCDGIIHQLLKTGTTAMADIVLINPRFKASFWGMEEALPTMGKKANLPVACLPLLAALTPAEHTITVMDENVEEIDWDRCARADIVGLTGMSVQRFRMTEIVTELKRRDCFVVMGGPWITVEEEYFGDLVDVIFVGEAEESWPKFLKEWAEGTHASRYEQAERTDMTKVPVPRFDVINMKRYAFGSLQFSRGCPFQCEFCDIIVTFGRRPRIKTAEQVIAELDAIRKAGSRIVFIVDDNLIGNKKAIKVVLEEVIRWQEKHGYPLTLFTEASIDLADDDELMRMMVRANFIAVFVGIESPSEDALRETKKFQNVREKGGTMLEKVHRIQDSGISVWCGMIVGFDSDDKTIFDRQIEFIQESRIPMVMSGMLVAIPKTPLHKRLAAEGRLDTADKPAYGTNVIPLGLSREELRDGYVKVMSTLYEPETYFKRVEDLFGNPNFDIGYGHSSLNSYWRWRPLRKLYVEAINAVAALAFFIRMDQTTPNPSLRRFYRSQVFGLLKRRRRPGLLLFYMIHVAMHYHAQKMAQSMVGEQREIVNSY